MRVTSLRCTGPALLAAAGALFAACAASPPAAPAGVGGSPGEAGAGMGGSGVGGDTMGLKLGTGGPYTLPKASGSCTLTTVPGAIASTAAAYTAWKNAFVTSNGAAGSLRVQRPTNSNDTVSEGIGYGMLAAVYMNDRPTFDSLWRYGQAHLNTKGLMTWHLTSSGTPFNNPSTNMPDPGSASDGDVDMIWALIMASDQWISNDYLDAAANMIQAMRQNSIGPDGTLKPGDTWGGTTLTDPSYFSPAYFRVFAVVVGDPLWARDILDKNYLILAGVAGTNGLVPDWTTNSAVTNMGFLMPNYDNSTYGYDAARTPWRIAMDWCFNGEVRAHTYLMKVGAFFNGVGANNIVDGYALSGSPKGSAKNMAFIGPAGVAGMAGFPTLLDAAFTYGASGQGDQSYFPSSLRLISMLMMSGSFLDYTK